MPLRPRPSRSRSGSGTGERVHLFDLPAIRHSLGLLLSEPRPSVASDWRHGCVHVGRSQYRVSPMQGLRLHHALVCRGQKPRSDGCERPPNAAGSISGCAALGEWELAAASCEVAAIRRRRTRGACSPPLASELNSSLVKVTDALVMTVSASTPNSLDKRQPVRLAEPRHVVPARSDG